MQDLPERQILLCHNDNIGRQLFVDQFDRTNPVKTLKKLADIVKLEQAVDMPPEEEHLLTDR